MKQGRSKFTIRFTPFTTYERFNNETDQLFLHCAEDKERESSATGGLTALEAAWNVTNAIQVRCDFFLFICFKLALLRECSWSVYRIQFIMVVIGLYLLWLLWHGYVLIQDKY